MMDEAVSLRALHIDPERGIVEVITLEPHEIRGLLGGGRPDTLDLDATHCLVINGGDRDGEHRTRFRIAGMPRPFFGPALVLGLVHGNWTPATLEAESVAARIRWEEWDAAGEDYVAMAARP